tara:strand:+ start:304 stop:573 length:270 start_codon:yes stop_codon:yes gene_type:complete
MSNNNLDNLVQIIINQTNYDEEKAKNKLQEWEGNHINVIKEYLNPDFRNKKVTSKKKSVNQQMMTQIRTFMDNISKEHQKRKDKGLTKV